MVYHIVLRASVVCLLSIIAFNTWAESSVWKVSKGKNCFYLGGTIHVLTPSDHPLPKEFFVAYKDADKLIFEVDIAETNTRESPAKMMAAMQYPAGQTLADDLNQDTFKRLGGFLQSRGIPIQHFSGYYPWAVSLMVSMIEYQRMGMVPEYGVDQYFHQKAVADKKQLGSLETMEQQISFMETMGNIEPNMMLNYTLRDLKELPSLIAFMKKAWRSGDLEAFTKHESMVAMKAEFPVFHNMLVTQRNNNWMQELTKLNSDSLKEFVLVGALHLNDKEGLLNQLASSGYKVEQLK